MRYSDDIALAIAFDNGAFILAVYGKGFVDDDIALIYTRAKLDNVAILRLIYGFLQKWAVQIRAKSKKHEKKFHCIALDFKNLFLDSMAKMQSALIISITQKPILG